MTQISVVLTARDDLRQKKTRLEGEISQQSQEQNDIYQYLRKKLKDNYVAIAALEAKARKEACYNRSRPFRPKKTISVWLWLEIPLVYYSSIRDILRLLGLFIGPVALPASRKTRFRVRC